MKRVNRRGRDMRSEYDFSKGVRGRYAARYAQGTNLVKLDPGLSDIFPDSDSVNDALRTIARLVRSREGATSLARK